MWESIHIFDNKTQRARQGSSYWVLERERDIADGELAIP